MSSLWLVLSVGRKRCWREPRDVLYGRLFCNEEVQKCGKEWGEIVGEGGGRGGRVRLSSDLDRKTGGRLRNWSKLRLPSGCVPNGSDFGSGRGNRNLFRLAGRGCGCGVTERALTLFCRHTRRWMFGLGEATLDQSALWRALHVLAFHPLHSRFVPFPLTPYGFVLAGSTVLLTATPKNLLLCTQRYRRGWPSGAVSCAIWRTWAFL